MPTHNSFAYRSYLSTCTIYNKAPSVDTTSNPLEVNFN